MSLLRSGLMGPLALALAAAASLTGPAMAVDETTATPAAAPQPAPAATPLTDIDILRIGADDADRMTVPVEIGNGGPYPFIIDTGSHRSIVATELAKRLSLPDLPPVEIISMAGRETVASVHLEQISFGKQVMRDLPALSIAHDSLGSAGLIGLDSLQDKRVTLDFRKRQLAVSKSSGLTASYSDAFTIVVEARSKFGQLIIVNSRLDGRRVNVILDTGAEISVGNMALFNNLREKKLVVAPSKVEITSVTGQPVQALFTVVRKLEIDKVTLNNVPMVFLDAPPFAELDLADKPSMLLGMRMLRMFDRVAIDFGNRHVDFSIPRETKPGSLSGQLLAAR